MSIAAAVLTAQLLVHTSTRSPATDAIPVVQAAHHTDSWAILAREKTAAAHEAHEAHARHVAHEEYLQEKAQERHSLPQPPWHAVSATPSGYKPVAAGSGPSGGNSPSTDSTVSTEGLGAVEACIINAESGGNPQVMNASGHYGLFQFSESTWEAAGGSAAMFGDAPAAYQEQLFWNIASQGTGMIETTWTNYDGCTP